MLASVDKAKVGLGHVGSEGYERAEGADGRGLGDCDGEGCASLERK